MTHDTVSVTLFLDFWDPLLGILVVTISKDRLINYKFLENKKK